MSCKLTQEESDYLDNMPEAVMFMRHSNLTCSEKHHLGKNGNLDIYSPEPTRPDYDLICDDCLQKLPIVDQIEYQNMIERWISKQEEPRRQKKIELHNSILKKCPYFAEIMPLIKWGVINAKI